MTRSSFFLYFVLIVITAASFSTAQTTTAAFLGTVTDSSGAVLPGAQVAASNVETGLKRTTITNEAGRFLLSELPPGLYELTVSLPPFETLVRKGLTLTVGQEASLTVSMRVGGLSEQVEVVGDAPIVDTSQSSVSDVVEEARITQLPLNGRDFTQLVAVEPATVMLRNTNTGSNNRGFGTRMSVAGSRPEQTAWLLDGMNINGGGSFGTPGTAGGGLLGVDSVREFQVLTTNYGSEFGGKGGGVVNMVTKSGTNQLHGSVYEFLRNSALDAANWADNAFGNKKAPFKRNQFGFSVGGPISKNRTFFFVNYEGLRQPLGMTNVAVVPDANAHRGLIPGADGSLQQVQIAPEIVPVLNSWPLPNAGNLPGGVGYLSSPASQYTTEDYYTARIDHQISDRQSLFGRVSIDTASQTTPDPVPISNVLQQTWPRYVTVQLVSVWSAKLLTTTRAGMSRNNAALNIAMTKAFTPSTVFPNPDYPPQIGVSGLTRFGPQTFNIQNTVQNVYQFQENVTYTSGKSTYKFGFDYLKLDPNLNSGLNNNGQFTWASLSAFLQDAPLQQFGSAIPGNQAYKSYRQNLFGFYFSDDWKMNAKLTWNLGLRYEPYTGPTEKWGRVSVIRQNWVTATKFDTGGPLFESPGNKYFAPRVGFAFDPSGDGKTAIRGGAAIFYDPLTPSEYSQAARANAPFSASILAIPRNAQGQVANYATALAFVTSIAPSYLTPQFSATTSPTIVQYKPDATYNMNLNLTVERQIAQDFAASIGYVGSRGYHQARAQNLNVKYPTIVNGRSFVDPNSPLPNPNLSQGTITVTDGQSFYNGLLTQLKKRLSRSYQFQVSYTWSKAIDDGTNVAATGYASEGGNASRPWETKANRGLSPLHQAQTFVVNGIRSLPALSGHKVVSSIFGGWQATGIFTAASGTPFTPLMTGTNMNDNGAAGGNGNTRTPDWVGGSRSFSSITSGTTPGCTFTNGIPGPYVAGRANSVAPGQQLGTPHLWFDPCAFAVPPANFYGNAGRGILIGPGATRLDMSLAKNIRLGEIAKAEFRTEVFNLLNRANFSNPDRQVLNATNNSLIGTSGQITTTATSSRQIQFGLKVTF